jgi:hypothetical protein
MLMYYNDLKSLIGVGLHLHASFIVYVGYPDITLFHIGRL